MGERDGRFAMRWERGKGRGVTRGKWQVVLWTGAGEPGNRRKRNAVEDGLFCRSIQRSKILLESYFRLAGKLKKLDWRLKQLAIVLTRTRVFAQSKPKIQAEMISGKFWKICQQKNRCFRGSQEIHLSPFVLLSSCGTDCPSSLLDSNTRSTERPVLQRE